MCLFVNSRIDTTHGGNGSGIPLQVCMLKVSMKLIIHTNMFLLITSLIFNRFSIRKKFWKVETRMLEMLYLFQMLFMLEMLKI